MAVYRVIWRSMCGVLITAGVVAGLIVLPVKVWVLVGLLAIILAFVAVVGRSAKDRQAGRSGVESLLRALVVAVAVIAVLGLGAVLQGSVVLLLLLVGVSSPRLVGRMLSGVTRAPEPPPGAVSTRQLCQEWRESYLSLRQAPTPAARIRIVRARQRCLDELERRDPDGFQAWLASAASAGGDPSRFVTESRRDNPPDQQVT
ncbi:hypothetical protein E1218_26865 [Kribbella turkmenica]|uniref:Uncharacterized protein n=1 Tax=Kribbella turkmenica TaxID=2530375 RepID=A0A4R4WGD8_9ACTN|nr:hypothetical protein [Kribbella turkmenica]TDD18002.1 hypothetical protein E1218_26865 [Kribbella turkmenica]